MIKNRKRFQEGFTLVEVALAIALGIIIIIGAVLGFGAVRDSQSERESRNRLGSLKAMIEQFRSANNGITPTIGSLRTIWAERRKKDVLNSPWGGEAKPIGVGSGLLNYVQDATIAAATSNVANAGGIGYVTNAGASFSVFDRVSGALGTVNDYAIFYFDKNGLGPLYAIGGE